MAEGTNLYRYTFTALNAYSIPQYTLKEKGEKGKPHFGRKVEFILKSRYVLETNTNEPQW